MPVVSKVYIVGTANGTGSQAICQTQQALFGNILGILPKQEDRARLQVSLQSTVKHGRQIHLKVLNQPKSKQAATTTTMTLSPSKSKGFYVYGTGGIGVVLAEVLFDMGFELIGAFDDGEDKGLFYGVHVKPGLQRSNAAFPALDKPLFVCLGNNRLRKNTVSKIEAPFMVGVHSRAHVSPTAELGEGTMVFHGSYVQAEARIGRHVIINTATSIDHHCRLGDFVHIAPQVALCGLCFVGEGTEIGAGASVLPSVRIGKWCRIGAGSVVLNDLPDYATAVGNPAKVIKIKGERI